MTESDVDQSLAEAFRNAPHPTQDEIVSHACDECFRVRDDFAPHSSLTVPGEVLEYHYDSLPLFTPKAFRYFLPGYISHVLNNPESPMAAWVIERLQDLATQDSFWSTRTALLSEGEREAIRGFLRFIYEVPSFAPHIADIYDALVLWGDHPNLPLNPDAPKSGAPVS
jgi:hypothetical protein